LASSSSYDGTTSTAAITTTTFLAVLCAK